MRILNVFRAAAFLVPSTFPRQHPFTIIRIHTPPDAVSYTSTDTKHTTAPKGDRRCTGGVHIRSDL